MQNNNQIAEEVTAENRRISRKDREAYIFLSLFLIILSFFIVLVSLSHIDKVQARLVFKQLSEILQENRGLRILRTELEKFTGFRVTERRTLQNIKSEWSATLPLLDIDLSPDNSTIEVNVPYYELISSTDSIAIRKDRRELLTRIANLMLIIGQEQQQVYTDISYYGPQLGSAKTNPRSELLPLSILGISNVARLIESEQVPTHALTLHHTFIEQEPIIRINFRLDSVLPERLRIPPTHSIRALPG